MDSVNKSLAQNYKQINESTNRLSEQNRTLLHELNLHMAQQTTDFHHRMATNSNRVSANTYQLWQQPIPQSLILRMDPNDAANAYVYNSNLLLSNNSNK